jgi:2-keto-4-pentenoate hydratase
MLLAARTGADRVPLQQDVRPPDSATALMRCRMRSLATLGPVGGWKVGAKGSAGLEPSLRAPAGRAGCWPAGCPTVTGSAWAMRGMELEVAVRLGRDLDAGGRVP